MEEEIQVAIHHRGHCSCSDVDGLHDREQEGQPATDGFREILGHPGNGCGQDQIQGRIVLGRIG